MKKLWINTGELSGDIQAAEFVKEFKKIAPHIDILGMGGPHLENAGMRCLYRIEQLSVMGVIEVLSVLPKIIRLLKQIKQSLIDEKPDYIILTDCPDFNFFIARMAKKLNIPVSYFIPPKVWAWRSGRIKFLKENVQKIYSILPFEANFYKKHNMNVQYIGNPLISLVNYNTISEISPLNFHIGLMPGSRKKEVELLLPEFARTINIIQKQIPQVQISLIRAPHFSEEYLHSFWQSSAPLKMVTPENRYAFMRTCTCILAASGTAVLESALAGVPTLVTYKVNPFSYYLGKHFVKVPWISLPNLIMNKEIFPECIQNQANSENLSNILLSWLSSPKQLIKIQHECSILRDICGDGESAKRFAHSFYTDFVLTPRHSNCENYS